MTDEQYEYIQAKLENLTDNQVAMFSNVSDLKTSNATSIVVLQNKVKQLEAQLIEKERTIQILLKQQA